MIRINLDVIHTLIGASVDTEYYTPPKSERKKLNCSIIILRRILKVLDVL